MFGPRTENSRLKDVFASARLDPREIESIEVLATPRNRGPAYVGPAGDGRTLNTAVADAYEYSRRELTEPAPQSGSSGAMASRSDTTDRPGLPLPDVVDRVPKPSDISSQSEFPVPDTSGARDLNPAIDIPVGASVGLPPQSRSDFREPRDPRGMRPETVPETTGRLSSIDHREALASGGWSDTAEPRMPVDPTGRRGPDQIDTRFDRTSSSRADPTDPRFDQPGSRGSDRVDPRFDQPASRGSDRIDPRFDQPGSRGSDRSDPRFEQTGSRGSDRIDPRFDQPGSRSSDRIDPRFDQSGSRGSDRLDRRLDHTSPIGQDRTDPRFDRSGSRPDPERPTRPDSAGQVRVDMPDPRRLEPADPRFDSLGPSTNIVDSPESRRSGSSFDGRGSQRRDAGFDTRRPSGSSRGADTGDAGRPRERERMSLFPGSTSSFSSRSEGRRLRRSKRGSL